LPIKNGSGRFSIHFENNPFITGVFCGNTGEELIVVKVLSEYQEPIFAQMDSSGVPFGMTKRRDALRGLPVSVGEGAGGT
jgi:hypothetical protein